MKTLPHARAVCAPRASAPSTLAARNRRRGEFCNSRVSVLVTLLAGAPAWGQPSRPKALQAVEQARTAIVTAEIEWSSTDFKWMGAQERFHTQRLSEDEIIAVHRGNRQGRFSLREEDADMPPHSPELLLIADGAVWKRTQDQAGADWYPRTATRPGTEDLRTLGLSAGAYCAHVHQALWMDDVSQPSPRNYTESMEDGLHVVSAETDYGTYRWWIDAQKGWSPVRAAFLDGGKIASESRSTLKQYGDVWFPETVAFFNQRYKDGREPIEVVRIYSASFNRPEHPRQLTPNDIGVAPGAPVTRWTEDRTRPLEEVMWDGTKLVPQPDLRVLADLPPELKRTRNADGAGLPEPSDSATRSRESRDGAVEPGTAPPVASGRAPLAKRVEIVLSQWEQYTRAFIARYRLNDDQRQRALSILEACQQQGHAYLRSRQREFEEIEKRLAEIPKPPAAEQAARRARLQEDYARLRGPIDDVFENQLKPRLEKLPTRAQRRAAEDPAATQPNPAERRP